jgi:hypothetical protein
VSHLLVNVIGDIKSRTNGEGKVLESVGAVTATVLALVPGALYVWGFERIVGNWGVRISDRLLRFVGVSVVFHAVFAPLTYWLWANYVVAGHVVAGRPLPLALWLVAVGYVAIPTVAGAWIGRATLSAKDWAEHFTGPDPAPRAWDHLFASNPQGWMRLKLKSGAWMAACMRPPMRAAVPMQPATRRRRTSIWRRLPTSTRRRASFALSAIHRWFEARAYWFAGAK